MNRFTREEYAADFARREIVALCVTVSTEVRSQHGVTASCRQCRTENRNANMSIGSPLHRNRYRSWVYNGRRKPNNGVPH